MAHGLFASIMLLAIAITSACFYSHKGRWYAAGKQGTIPAMPGFRFVYRYTQISTVLFCTLAFFSDHFLLLKVYHSTAMLYVGLCTAFVGLAVFIWARVSLSCEYSPCFDSFVPTRLVCTGPYAYVRHPIYSGNLVLLAGLVLATSSLWVLINTLVVAVYYVGSARREEDVLLGSLSGYREYAGMTGRFVPRLCECAVRRKSLPPNSETGETGVRS